MSAPARVSLNHPRDGVQTSEIMGSLNTTGPWGPAMDVILSLVPIAFLVTVTLVRRIRLPTRISLPVSAVMLYLFRLVYFGHPANFINASTLQGCLEWITPVSIAAGAISLFAVMDNTLCTPYIVEHIKSLSGRHPVAEVMLLGWAFAYLLEGVAGFGTPPALVSPVLAAMGHDPVNTVVCVLMMNTLATQFGAVGTPIWFGLKGLGLSDNELLKVSYKTGVLCALSSMIMPLLAAWFLIPWRDLKQNLIFIYASIIATAGPMMAVSFVNYEFPTLIGGVCGIFATSVLTYFRIGLTKRAERRSYNQDRNDTENLDDDEEKFNRAANGQNDASVNKELQHVTSMPQLIEVHNQKTLPGGRNLDEDVSQKLRASFQENLNTLSEHSPPMPTHPLPSKAGETPVVKDHNLLNGRERHPLIVGIARTLPLSMTVIILVITRASDTIKEKGLTRLEPAWDPSLRTLGDLKLSASLVIGLLNIFGENGSFEDSNRASVDWTYEILYVPFFLPFVVTAAVTLAWLRSDLQVSVKEILKSIWSRVKTIIVPLMGSLAFVSLLRNGGDAAPAAIIGRRLASALSEGWIVFTPYIGALGSFFSGSTTVSNLTFGRVHTAAAEGVGLDPTTLLALQTVGATMGNGWCINNIIQSKAVMNLNQTSEGVFMSRTAPLVLLFGVISIVFSLIFFGKDF